MSTPLFDLDAMFSLDPHPTGTLDAFAPAPGHAADAHAGQAFADLSAPLADHAAAGSMLADASPPPWMASPFGWATPDHGPPGGDRSAADPAASPAFDASAPDRWAADPWAADPFAARALELSTPGPHPGTAVDAHHGGPIDERAYVPDFAPAAAPTPGHVVLRAFDVDSTELAPDVGPALDGVAALLDGDPTAWIEVEGHASQSGDVEHNAELSLGRAEAVAGELFARGVPLDRVVVRAVGEARPMYREDSAAEMAGNRRVEVHVRSAQGSLHASPPPPPPTPSGRREFAGEPWDATYGGNESEAKAALGACLGFGLRQPLQVVLGAGPVGMAFAGGQCLGAVIDLGVGAATGESLSDRLATALPDNEDIVEAVAPVIPYVPGVPPLRIKP